MQAGYEMDLAHQIEISHIGVEVRNNKGKFY